jgi:hypothetical protein
MSNDTSDRFLLMCNENIPSNLNNKESYEEDFDPLVDIEITVDIMSIRTLDTTYFPTYPDFFVKVCINSEEYLSPLWQNSPYLETIHWTATADIPDDIEYVNITIELVKKSIYGDTPCDINEHQNTKTEKSTAEIMYSIRTGHWTGDDSIGDLSGYGRLNGFNENDFKNSEQAWELWFHVYQNDYDNDHIPYWMEVSVYNTDPQIDNTGEDLDSDGVPIEWEFTWMYDPNLWEDHAQLDTDEDSLTNLEEYYVSSWDSDPFRKDIYIEIDTMEQGPLGQNSSLSTRAKELLMTSFNRRNIVCHIDDGCMGGGGEIIPFDKKTYRYELKTFYNTYFLHNDSENWRKGVFRYAMIIYKFTASGMAYVGTHPWLYWHAPGTNTFVISAQNMHKMSIKLLKPIDFVYASAMMHETGHILGIDFLFPLGCDVKRSIHPRHLAFWLFRNYKSCMNYRYVYQILDYSDGSHGFFDYDDWSHLDFSFFEKKRITRF